MLTVGTLTIPNTNNVKISSRTRRLSEKLNQVDDFSYDAVTQIREHGKIHHLTRTRLRRAYRRISQSVNAPLPEFARQEANSYLTYLQTLVN